jgi:hypothetical protein
MDVFEYVAVMVTVVLALAVSHILTSLATMVANPERVRPYWVHFLWAILLLGLNLQAWLVLWTLHGQTQWPVGQIVMMLVSASLIFVAARVLEPELPPGARLDLRAHFSRVRFPLFATLSVFWLFPIVGRLIFTGGHLLEPEILARLVFLGLSLSGAVVKSPTWHAILAMVWAGLLIANLAFMRGQLA